MNQELFSNEKIQGPGPWNRGSGGVVESIDGRGTVKKGD
jgi:hypothetical protein